MGGTCSIPEEQILTAALFALGEERSQRVHTFVCNPQQSSQDDSGQGDSFEGLSLEQIAERLQTHPGVAAAAVRLMRGEGGDRLKCFVVPAPGVSPQTLEGDLRAWVGSWPVAAERPKRFNFGAALPTGPLGKAADW